MIAFFVIRCTSDLLNSSEFLLDTESIVHLESFSNHFVQSIPLTASYKSSKLFALKDGSSIKIRPAVRHHKFN